MLGVGGLFGAMSNLCYLIKSLVFHYGLGYQTVGMPLYFISVFMFGWENLSVLIPSGLRNKSFLPGGYIFCGVVSKSVFTAKQKNTTVVVHSVNPKDFFACCD